MNLSLDRRDVDKGYSPENCTWATAKEQARNRRNTRKILYEGEEIGIAALAESKGVKRETLVSRVVQRGWDLEKALKTPVRQRHDR